MGKSCQVVVLAEDQRHQRFVRYCLQQLKFGRHHIRFRDLPAGGSGEQWVRDRYADEVAEYRNRASHTITALVVVLDADNVSVQQRLDQLTKSLVDDGQEPRKQGERIVILIPKRSIETWILNLNGVVVDEATSYKRQRNGLDDQIEAAALQFIEWSRRNALVPEHCIPSLRMATQEIQRLF